jgi:hypothetical protein
VSSSSIPLHNSRAVSGWSGIATLLLFSVTWFGCTSESAEPDGSAPSVESDAPSAEDEQSDSDADGTPNPDPDVQAPPPDDTENAEPDTDTDTDTETDAETDTDTDTELDTEVGGSDDVQPDTGPTTGPTQPEGQTCEGGDFYYPNINRRSDDGRFVLRIADVKPTSDALWTFTLQLFDSTGEWASGQALTLRLAVESSDDWAETAAAETTTPGVYETDLPLALPSADRWQLQVVVAGATPSRIAFLFCNPDPDR